MIEKMDKRGLRRGADCPVEIELSDYLTGKVSIRKRTVLEKHLVNCGFCLEQLDLAQKALTRQGCKKDMKEQPV